MFIILAVYGLSLSLVCPSLSLSRSLSGCLEKYPASSSSVRKLTLGFECGLIFIIYFSSPAVSRTPSLPLNLIDKILYRVE